MYQPGEKVLYIWRNELRTGTVYSVQPFQMLVERDWLTPEHQEKMLDLVVDDAIVERVTTEAVEAVRRLWEGDK